MKYHERIMYRDFNGYVSLFTDGVKAHATFIENGGKEQIIEWYKDTKTNEPWIPKRKNFIALVKEIIREGDLATNSNK